jgi:hypothetical protein
MIVGAERIQQTAYFAEPIHKNQSYGSFKIQLYLKGKMQYVLSTAFKKS